MLSDAFRDHERLLWGLSYRMLGSASEADDVVQDTFVRAIERAPDARDTLRPWLVRVAMNLSRDRLRRRRRRYVGEWLPEPYFEQPGAPDPEQQLDQQQSLTVALLHVLETLSPVERAVFLLHDVFGLRFAEVAKVVEALFPYFLDNPQQMPARWHADIAAAQGRTALARIVSDYIAGMTDRFALQLHERLIGVKVEV